MSNARTSTRSFVKHEGVYTLGRIEFLLRNSKQLEPNTDGETCTDSMSSIAFKSIDDEVAEILVVKDADTEKIAIQVATEDPQYLTSDGVQLVDGLLISCEEVNGKKTVDVRFTLSKEAPTLSNDAGSSTTEEFSSVIFLRN